jgi:hypothetical protein
MHSEPHSSKGRLYTRRRIILVVVVSVGHPGIITQIVKSLSMFLYGNTYGFHSVLIYADLSHSNPRGRVHLKPINSIAGLPHVGA